MRQHITVYNLSLGTLTAALSLNLNKAIDRHTDSIRVVTVRNVVGSIGESISSAETEDTIDVSSFSLEAHAKRWHAVTI